MRTFCRGGNLRALITRDGLPDALESLRPMVQKYFGSALNGTILNNSSSPDPTADERPPSSTKHELLDETLHRALVDCVNTGPSQLPLEPLVQYHDQITHMGVTFSTTRRHAGNSLVLFKTGPSPLQRAGQIQRIFSHTRRRDGDRPETVTDYFCVVLQYQELTDEEATHDPYRVFALLEARVCRKGFLPSLTVIQLSWIISHFASCPYKLGEFGDDFHVVLSLNRVSLCFKPTQHY